MKTITITEALAELKTLDKRIEKKRASVGIYLIRQEKFKDPLATQGGSDAFVKAERQSIADLEENIIAIRSAIQKANFETSVTIAGVTRTITDWLSWRRDVAPKQVTFLGRLRATIDEMRKKAAGINAQVVGAGEAKSPEDVIVNLDEKQLIEDTEKLETTLGYLDGQLSLKNATVTISVAD